MSGHMRCPECGNPIHFDIPDEQQCSECGWGSEDDLEDCVRSRCDEIGLDFDALLRDFDGDLETLDAYSWAMSKDD
jgi:hypothetical protein